MAWHRHLPFPCAFFVSQALTYNLDRIPTSLPSNLGVKQIAVGEDHCLALTSSGRVYAWGSGRRGQLGLGAFDNCPSPMPVDLRRRVAQIAAGATHSVALVAAGSIYTWGSGLQLGLGVFTGTGDVAEPSPVKALAKYRVRSIAAGWDFTQAVTNDGEVFAFGANAFGQLGVGDTKPRVIPTLVEGLKLNGVSAVVPLP